MKKTELFNIKVGDSFKIGDVEFIKFGQDGDKVTAVTRDIVFSSVFGDDSNFAKSKVLKRLENEILPKFAEEIGMDNICDITTDLTTLDGLKPYEDLTSKISLPTFDFYRQNVALFDKYKLNTWWWLATPDTAQPHYDPEWIVCVSPHGNFSSFNYRCNYDFGVRPFLRFESSIFVSCEE